MTLCANNYLLLVKLLADKEKEGEKRHFFINDYLAYTIKIEEVTRYTSLVHFEQDSFKQSIFEQDTDKKSLKGEKKLVVSTVVNLMHPRMTIRLYHDARMAEVISTQDIQQVKPRYDYPNQHMHQQDEKQQINEFLHEWLQLCLQLGQVSVELQA